MLIADRPLSSAMTNPPDEYKPTFFDRHGPGAAGLVTARLWGVCIGLLTLALLSRNGLTIKSVAGGIGAGVLVAGLGPALGFAFETIWGAIAVNGGSTPSTPQYSYEKSLVMQGRIDEALLSIEAIVGSDPKSIQARLFAAELYLRERNDAGRSAELLRQAQAIRPISVGDDIYIANRLVDLYMGPLEAPDRAIRELRRVIDRYGDSATADHARAALATLKARYQVPGTSPTN
jgi:hypothetical protein